ncbi:hypothetical protein Kisp01_27630 [Kineosporia sp. NBRC 101677]|nr:hypothetical protein Kisp01_27630 [Kineosporia sp. NBRC 101677]
MGTGDPGNSYMDKMLFENTLVAGHPQSAYDVQTVGGNDCTWIRCGHSATQQHGAVFKGGLHSFLWVDYNTESVGSSGKNARTTGTVSNGSTALTVASASGIPQAIRSLWPAPRMCSAGTSSPPWRISAAPASPWPILRAPLSPTCL